MAADDRTPIFVGVAQVEQREDDPNAAKEPLDLMVQAVEAAAQDCRRRSFAPRRTKVPCPATKAETFGSRRA